MIAPFQAEDDIDLLDFLNSVQKTTGLHESDFMKLKSRP
jgi:hypothetical protein